MKRFVRWIALAAAAAPAAAFAHVKWFATGAGIYARPYRLSDGPVMIWIAILAGALTLAAYLEKGTSVPQRLAARLRRAAPYAVSAAGAAFGAGLIIFSSLGFLFAPDTAADGALGMILVVLQAIAGIMMLLGVHARAGSILLLVIFALAGVHYGPLFSLETLDIAGLAFFVAAAGRPRWRLMESEYVAQIWARSRRYAVPVLRIATGINLAVLAFTEKLLSPALTQEFLSRYHWNFMAALGFHGFTDYWFAFAAGMTELLFGLLFITGYITRITVLGLGIFLATTLVLLGPIELIGHIPHFCIALVLLWLGGKNSDT